MKKILIVDDIKGWRDFHYQVISDLFEDYEILTAESARDAYNLVMENNEKPFDIIITDMQMENDFEPKYAGEWLIEQIKTFKNYSKTKIIIISATYNIQQIAEFYNVNYIRKSTARNFISSYDFIKEL